MATFKVKYKEMTKAIQTLLCTVDNGADVVNAKHWLTDQVIKICLQLLIKQGKMPSTVQCHFVFTCKNIYHI